MVTLILQSLAILCMKARIDSCTGRPLKAWRFDQLVTRILWTVFLDRMPVIRGGTNKITQNYLSLLSRILVIPQGANHSNGETMDPFKRFLHCHQTHRRCFTTFICYYSMCIWMCPYHVTLTLIGQACGSWLVESWVYPKDKLECSAMVEAMDPFKMAPTSISDTYKVFHHPHLLWMCTWMYLNTQQFLKLATKLVELVEISKRFSNIPRG